MFQTSNLFAHPVVDCHERVNQKIGLETKANENKIIQVFRSKNAGYARELRELSAKLYAANVHVHPQC